MLNNEVPSYSEALDVLTKPDEKLWGKMKRPFPTNAWWTPACLEGGEWTIHPLPYQLQLRRDRAAVCYPEYLYSEKYFSSVFIDHFHVGCREELLGHRVVKYDDMCARFAWEREEEESAMECPVVQGSPYISFFFKNSTPALRSVFAIAADYSGVFTGDVFKVPLNNGQTWMIYVSKPLELQFSVNPCVIQATKPFTGALRIALAPSSPEAALMLDRCRSVIPIGVTTRYNISEESLTYEYEYDTELMSPAADREGLLMMALLHHVKLNVSLVLENAEPWYKSIKGPMHGVKGTRWTMAKELLPVWWNSVHKIDAKHAEVIRGALYVEATIPNHCTDPYGFGKRLAAVGRLAIIADELGEDVIASHLRERMKAMIEPWLNGSNTDALVYDPIWGGVISTFGTRDANVDYGSGMYNDHHFQYGYFVYAAAVIARHDKEWSATKIQPIFDLIRDYANSSSEDPFFPRLRHFDFYACHSWASGLFCFQDGKNQESSSEAINAYYAVALLGKAMGISQLADYGTALFQLEITATQTYWHITDDPSPIYPVPFSHNGTVGIVWGGKVDYGTWFGPNLEYIHCIQMIPFLPLSELLFSKEWIVKVMDRIGHLKDDPNVEVSWRGLLWMSLAVLDKEAAWKGFTQLNGLPDLGNSVANALYWIATRPSL